MSALGTLRRCRQRAGASGAGRIAVGEQNFADLERQHDLVPLDAEVGVDGAARKLADIISAMATPLTPQLASALQRSRLLWPRPRAPGASSHPCASHLRFAKDGHLEAYHAEGQERPIADQEKGPQKAAAASISYRAAY